MPYLFLSTSEAILLEDAIKCQRRNELPWQEFISSHGDMLLKIGSVITDSGDSYMISLESEECWFLILCIRSSQVVGGKSLGLDLLRKLYNNLKPPHEELFPEEVTPIIQEKEKKDDK
jgi:hypothetical protein